MRLPTLLIAAAMFTATTAAPAQARLGAPVEAIQHSALVQGDRYFRFDGLVGSRYRFSGASRCVFGTGILALDTWNHEVVQQTLVMRIPTTPYEEWMLKRIAGLFLDEAGLSGKPRQEALDALFHSYRTAKPVEKKLGKTVELHTYCNPDLNSLMLVVGLVPKP